MVLVGCSRPEDPVRARGAETCPKPVEDIDWCFMERLDEQHPPKADVEVLFGPLSERHVGLPVDLRIRITNHTRYVCTYEFNVESNDFADGEPTKVTVDVPGEIRPEGSVETVQRTPVIKDPYPLFYVDGLFRFCR
ncbi:hypothetical protein [Streptomyces sp. NPDC127084]|uniref:hypothetical protein n=1 Tax=Streptomyces sp. NPDC127084 TaxID=3347133 RepID=UPI00364E4CEB